MLTQLEVFHYCMKQQAVLCQLLFDSLAVPTNSQMLNAQIIWHITPYYI